MQLDSGNYNDSGESLHQPHAAAQTH